MNVDHRDLHVLTHCFPTLRSSELYRSATAVPTWVSPVARRTSSSGCCAHRRSSSAPVKPDAPTMPIEIIARSCKILHDHAKAFQPAPQTRWEQRVWGAGSSVGRAVRRGVGLRDPW